MRGHSAIIGWAIGLLLLNLPKGPADSPCTTRRASRGCLWGAPLVVQLFAGKVSLLVSRQPRDNIQGGSLYESSNSLLSDWQSTGIWTFVPSCFRDSVTSIIARSARNCAPQTISWGRHALGKLRSQGCCELKGGVTWCPSRVVWWHRQYNMHHSTRVAQQERSRSDGPGGV